MPGDSNERPKGDEGTPQVRNWSSLDAHTIINMATSEAARILGREDIGTIEVGKCADIAGFDLGGAELAGSLADPLAGFVLAGVNPRAKLTMVNGSVVVHDHKLLCADEQQVAEATNRSPSDCSNSRLNVSSWRCAMVNRRHSRMFACPICTR